MKLSTGLRSITYSFFFLAIALLQACGGGGGGGPAAPAIANALSQSYLEDETITALVFSNTGGRTLTSCTADTLPDGLTVSVSSDATTCEVSGRPSTPSAEMMVTVTATNATASDTATVAITITANTLSVSVSSAGIKTIQFDWSAYSNATSYKLFVNPDGVSGFSILQDNLTGLTTNVTLPVHLTDWINASYVLEAYDDAGKLKESSPISISSLMLSSIGYGKASNSEALDRFGWTVSLSTDGSTLAVGATREDSSATGISTDGTGEADNGALSSGAVYIYARSGSVWSQQAYVKASNAEAIDYFGFSVSLSADGNTLAVAAYAEDSSATGISTDGTSEADNGASESGAVYIYTRSGSVWSQQAYVKASNTEASDFFGWTVSLSADGSTLAVGARDEDSSATGISTDGTGESDNGALSSGAVYIYARSGSVWSQQAYVKASNAEAGDNFGYAVSLSTDGSTLAVGARREDSSATGISTDGTGEADNGALSSGAVYIYARSGSVWSQQAYVKASNAEAIDHFGEVVSLSADGSTLVVGAFLEDSSATGISTDGTGESDNSASKSGAVYIYARSGSVWSQQAYVKASNAEAGDNFGKAVSLSADGSTLVVGAFLEDSSATGISTDGTGESDNGASNSGAVYIYTRSGSVWSQQAHVKASNAEMEDRLGSAVSLSSDGVTLVVGTYLEDSNAKGINGIQTDNSEADTGAVYIY